MNLRTTNLWPASELNDGTWKHQPSWTPRLLDTNLEIVSLHELSVTYVTLMFLDTGMYQLVIFEHIQICEALAAAQALIFAYRCMNPHVAAKTAEGQERLVAMLALYIWLQSINTLSMMIGCAYNYSIDCTFFPKCPRMWASKFSYFWKLLPHFIHFIRSRLRLGPSGSFGGRPGPRLRRRCRIWLYRSIHITELK